MTSGAFSQNTHYACRVEGGQGQPLCKLCRICLGERCSRNDVGRWHIQGQRAVVSEERRDWQRPRRRSRKQSGSCEQPDREAHQMRIPAGCGCGVVSMRQILGVSLLASGIV